VSLDLTGEPFPARLLTIATAADRLSVSAKTIYRLIGRGELPSIRLSATCVRVEESALAAFVRAREWRSDNLAVSTSSSSSRGASAYSDACRPVSRKRKRRSTKPSSGAESLTQTS
jgi:excisionase family DNA binding protein